MKNAGLKIRMTEYTERTYRAKVPSRGLTSYCIKAGETDLWISTEGDFRREALDLVLDLRYKLENYIQAHPEFLTTLSPYPEDPAAPSMIRDMIKATGGSGVGPMASVAGAIAQFTGLKLLNLTSQVIIENGGDIFLRTKNPVTVALFAGDSPLSNRIGLEIPPEIMPVGVCSSSGKIGHSLSMGMASLVSVVSDSALVADGAATAIGNCLKSKKDLDRFQDIITGFSGISGCVAVMDDMMAAWGEIKLVKI